MADTCSRIEDLPAIAELVPHAADMCFWQQIEQLSADFIQCKTSSHLNPEHPLKLGATELSAMALIEYAAQSVAVHGGALAWLTRPGCAPQAGFLVAVRNIELLQFKPTTAWLRVKAEVLIADAASKSYQVAISDADDNLVCQGRVLIAHPTEN